MDLKIGCSGIPMNIEEYVKKFRAVELDETFYNLPSHETALDWKKKAPKGFEFILKAEKTITDCSFTPSDALFRAWEITDNLAALLGVKVIVFETLPEFAPDVTNKNNMKEFFRSINKREYKMVWVPNAGWDDKDLKTVCEENGLVLAVDPLSEHLEYGDIRYYRLNGGDSKASRYKGLELKKLRDLCEEQGKKVLRHSIYVFFNNTHKMPDALRFEWICKHTGPIREINVSFLENLCGEIEVREESENVQRLSREAEKIVMLILHTEYAKVDIDIEKTKLRDMCKELFPDKEYLYDMIYGQRFDRLWEQFRVEETEA